MLAMLYGFFASKPEREDPLKENPQALNNEIINQLGEAYLTKYPEKTFLHGNQAQAERLKACVENSAKDRWHFLSDVYKTLPNCNGFLAGQIESMFISAFSITSQKLLDIGDPACCLEPMIEISKNMENKINKHDFNQVSVVNGEIELKGFPARTN